MHSTHCTRAARGGFLEVGKDAPMGVYTYYVKYRSIEDVPIEERGNFTLLY